ncbi:MAG: CoA transferase [Acidobacteria bacterium]|nr:CoA transferase [Acidobacteriota bacterium]
MGILTGIRVLDLATYIAGPAAATIMSDHGAEVIKVERPPHGDPYRYLSQLPAMPVSEHLYCWLLDGRNKKSVALDLVHASARGVLEKLVAWCDVLVTNFQPALLLKFRLRYEDLAPLNGRMIYASVTGYGETGEEADKPGYDQTAYWARSGLMGMMHQAGADPVQSPAGFGDHPTSMALFAAIMMALYQRERTGRGSKVTTSLMANGAWANSCQIQASFVGAEWPVRRTRANPNNPLVNHYVTRDGHRFILCLLEPARDWERLCRALEWGRLLEDARFCTPQGRHENSPELVAMIDAEVAGKDMAEWAQIFRRHDIVWGPVPTMDEVGQDAQMAAAGVYAEIDGAPWRTVLSPLQVEGEEKVKPSLAPAVGQHSDEVLHTLGYPEPEIRRLVETGAVFRGY